MMRMTKKSHLAALSLTLLLLSACNTTPNRAPVVDRPAGGSAAGRASLPAAPANRDPALYTVKKGDTLIRIALEYGQNYRDLVAWNNLSDPNAIEVDQVLRVVPPAAGGGAQTSAIVMPPSDARPLAPAAAALPRKSTPRGDKRPYSEAALAELRADGDTAGGKPDGAAPVRGQTPTPPAAVATAPNGGADDKLSWAWPTDGKVVAGFDEGKNKGLDITGRAGQQVVAAGAGKVMYAGSGIRGYGNLVIVKHNNSLLSAYAHNRSILVKEGQNVSKGQAIAEMGDSDADAVKLHFEIRQQGKPVDPAKFLPPR
jgi:lipoprotein NlpD